MSKNKNIKLSVQYINIMPGKKIVTRDEFSNYDFKNLSKIIDINIDPDIAFDYLLLIAVDKLISAINGIEKIALIRSSHPKYPGIQLILEGDIRADKSLIPKYISWEKLENHQKTIEDLLPIYED